MKRIKRVSLLVVLILLVGLLPQVTLKVNAASYSVSTAINGINVVRNTNYMVVYNVRGSNTNTNIYGYEVVVTAGVVTSVGGNNNSIPSDEGSFVVSGHGTSIEWLKKNVLIGMKASYTNKSVTFTYDNDTLLTHLDLKILAMKDAYFNARSTYRIIDYSGLMQRIEAVDDEYELLLTAYNSDKSYDLSKNSAPLFAEITEIKGLCSESSGVEMRGVWIRPTQTTTTAVENYVQQLYDAGINMICIETLYSSTMIMPMPEDSLFEQNPLWKGFDMLQAFIDACHSRDMELHIWMPVYYVGHGLDNTACVGVKKPEWRTVSNTGQYYSPGDESKFVFLSPANPEVKKFLIDTYRYILTKYDIDGFQLDYIRYYSSGEVDFGYDSITTSAFRAKYCVTPSYNKKASYWDDWVAFRAGFVTDMVKSVRNLIDEVNPDVLLSADVSAYYESGYENIYQDSVTWLREGYLDMIHPMAYGIGYTNLMEDFVNIAEDCYVGVGLGAYLDMLSSEDLAEQAEDMARIGASGSVFFEASAFLRKEVGEILNKSLYRNRAIPPTLNERNAVLILTEDAITRIDEVILPLQGIIPAQASSIKAKLNIIKATAEKSLFNQVINDIESAVSTVNTLTNKAAKKALLDDLEFIRIITKNALRSGLAIKNYFVIEGNTAIGFCSGGTQSMTAEMAKTLLDGTVTVRDKSGSLLDDNKKIGTGCIISNGIFSYTVVIKGDTNGDGEISSVDYLITKRIFLGTYTPDNNQNRAAAISDGVTSRASDYLKIKRHFLGTYDLYA